MVLSTQEKVTVLLPQVLKNDVARLKDRLKISMNSIYQTAITEYVAKMKREELRKEAAMMIDEYRNNPEIQEWIEFEDELVQ